MAIDYSLEEKQVKAMIASLVDYNLNTSYEAFKAQPVGDNWSKLVS